MQVWDVGMYIYVIVVFCDMLCLLLGLAGCAQDPANMENIMLHNLSQDTC